MSIIIRIVSSKTGKTQTVSEVPGICEKKTFKHPVDAHNHALNIKNEIEKLDGSAVIE